jgi:diguanylate cyclase (GGDEF)-like protein
MNPKMLRIYEEEAGAQLYDSLTGLYNHGLFQVLLAHEVRRSERTGRPFTLALIDVDWFAEFNEQHGYAIGDRALKQISRLIQANIRQVDIACRFGSDLFALLLVDADADGAKLPLERLRNAISQTANSWLTASIGMACFPEDLGGPDDRRGPAELIAKACETL